MGLPIHRFRLRLWCEHYFAHSDPIGQWRVGIVGNSRGICPTASRDLRVGSGLRDPVGPRAGLCRYLGSGEARTECDPMLLTSSPTGARKPRAAHPEPERRLGSWVKPQTKPDQNSTMAAPQVRPAPKTTSRTRSPGWIRPSRTASSMAIPTLAALVLP